MENFIATWTKRGVLILLVIMSIAFYRSCEAKGLDPSPTDYVPRTTSTP